MIPPIEGKRETLVLVWLVHAWWRWRRTDGCDRVGRAGGHDEHRAPLASATNNDKS